MGQKGIVIGVVALILGGLLGRFVIPGGDSRGTPAFRRIRLFNASDRPVTAKVDVYRGAMKIKTFDYANFLEKTARFDDETSVGFVEGMEKTIGITKVVVAFSYTNGTPKVSTVTLDLGDASPSKIDELTAAFDYEYCLRAAIHHSSDDRNPKMVVVEDRKCAP